MINKNDNGHKEPNNDLRNQAIDTTLERIDSVSKLPDTEKKRDEVVIGTRSLAQFLGIYEDGLKRQLFNQTPMEQDFLTSRYLERVGSSGSLATAGRDLANCLQYGADYDLKLSRAPTMQMGLNIPTPGLNMGGGGMGGGFGGISPAGNYTSTQQNQPIQQQYPQFPQNWDFQNDKDKS